MKPQANSRTPDNKTIVAAAAEGPPPCDELPAGWERTAVTLRLTPARKKALLALRPAGEPGEAPTAALDRAIELAAASLLEVEPAKAGPTPQPSARADELARLGDALRSLAEEVHAARRDWMRAASALPAIAADLSSLRRSITAAARLGEIESTDEDNFDAAIPILAWLEHEAAPACSWIVAQARFLRTRGASSGWMALELEARIVGGEALPQRVAARDSLIAVGPARAGSPAFALGQSESMVLTCRRTVQGWAIAARICDVAGKLGEEFTTFDI